ncbi:MAG: acetyl-CoA C-acetyltransferase [Candidatus Bathyarchaeota archaeon]|nr:acetyl-CoA C-acetyltransferase [Candidatus Bathyarchaeota archaeon]MDH5745823.1 acetyl-CoA C-acetyltransferase [Candidatus Bathyarchaeota archaeon]
MRKAVIVDYLRSPFSRSRPQQPERDKFNPLRMDHVAAMLIEKVIERTGVAPSEIDEVIPACALGVWEQWTYGGRSITMLAKLPVEVPAVFVDRQCGSSMSAIHFGAMEIMTGYSDLVFACGMEHMTHVPMAENQWINPPMDLIEKEEYRKKYEMDTGFVMGFTAERLFKEGAEKYGITREDMDKWSLRSHQLASKAQEGGFFDGEVMPVTVTYPDGNTETIDKDLSVRPTTSLERIQSLPPAFTSDGVITAGNSSPLNAGASCVMLASEDKAKSLGLTPLGTIKSVGWGAVHPAVMGKGPVPASKMALKHAGLSANDIDVWEINEAFAIVALWCMKELGINPEKVNVKGGAIAIGHPLGATGARLVGTIPRILEVEGEKYGLATACVGGGQGVATIIEKEK